MTLIQLNSQDLTEITTLFSEVIIKMQEEGIDQWDDNYPGNQVIQQDLDEKCLFGLKEGGRILAVISLNERYSPEYDALNWRLKSEDYLIVHRLAVHPNHQNKGIAKKAMMLAEDHALKHHYKGIRLDTYTENPKNLYFYAKLKYEQVGQVYFKRLSSPFICYEKIFDI